SRAGDELVVSRPPDKLLKKSPWRMLFPSVLVHGEELLLPLVPAPPRETFEIAAEEMRRRVASVDERRRTRATPTYRAAPVKLRAGELSEYELRAVRKGKAPQGAASNGAVRCTVCSRQRSSERTTPRCAPGRAAFSSRQSALPVRTASPKSWKSC